MGTGGMMGKGTMGKMGNGTMGITGPIGTTGTIGMIGPIGIIGPIGVMIILFLHFVKSFDGLKLHLPFFFLQTLYLKYILNRVFLHPYKYLISYVVHYCAETHKVWRTVGKNYDVYILKVHSEKVNLTDKLIMTLHHVLI